MGWFTPRSDGTWVRAIRQQEFAAILDWFSAYFLCCGIVILILIDVIGASNSTAPLITAVRYAAGGLLLAGASAGAGWLLGLLFGIPRSLSRFQRADAPAVDKSAPTPPINDRARPSRTNTNLEDVSDWLTKTIIGLGLAHLYFIPHYVWEKSGIIGKGIFGADPSGQSFCLLICAYFSVGGFWLGYVGTRTIITLLFDNVDQGSQKAFAEAANPKNLRVDEKTGALEPSNASVAQADAEVLVKGLQAMNTPFELAAWGAAKARKGELGPAMAVLAEAADKAPTDTWIKSLFETVRKIKPQ